MKITGPVTRAKVEALAADWANDPTTMVEIVHRKFNADHRSGGYAFLCDRGLLIYGFDGGSVFALDPGKKRSRLARVKQYWRESKRRNRQIELADVSPWHRTAIAALVAGVRSVADLAPEARPSVTDAERADALLIMLRRHVKEHTEAAALRALAGNDWLVDEPGEDSRAHPCPVCGLPALGTPWHYLSVCDDCYSKTTCCDGRVVTGHNTDFGGGFEAVHIDDRTICEHVSRTGQVWVEGQKCSMGEAKFGGVYVGLAPMHEYRDNDAGYLAWLANSDGYVINILRSHSPSESRVHRASCRTLRGQNPRGGGWTGEYVKVCADQLDDLEQWAVDHVRQPIPPCKICRPGHIVGQHISAEPTNQPSAPPASEVRHEIHGPPASSTVVQAWADDYIRLEHRSEQEQLRSQIRSSCRQLDPSGGQVLHATFYGAKRPNADVENLVLYNVDQSFTVAGRNGIRFELGADVPPAPDGAQYRFCYRYALAPRSGTLEHWQCGRPLASFDWTDLDASCNDPKAAHVWLALARGGVQPFWPAATPNTPFAVRVQVRPTQGTRCASGELIKGIFDGVVCALQTHTDISVLPEVVTRLARVLPATPDEIERHLLDSRRAVLGAVPRLVYPYRDGVKWDPADHMCVAGELLSAQVDDQLSTESDGQRWAIKGDVVELHR